MKHGFDLHGFLISMKLWTVEIAGAVLFIWFVVHIVLREMRELPWL